jgi:S-adenosylmethionine synthetase
MIILFFNKLDNFFKLMNYREDLEIKLQQVTLAMQEVVEDINKTDNEKQRITCELNELKEAIISKGVELNIELEAA